MHEQLFRLPDPLSHYCAVLGSAQVVADAWGEFGVVVTLESGALFRIQTYKSLEEANRLVEHLNDAEK